jgi:hypothetical protein
MPILLGSLGTIFFDYFNPDEHVEESLQTIGRWNYYGRAGAKEAGSQLRAHVARWGLFALPTSEAIYFMTRSDDSGEPLSEDCDYVVKVSGLPSQLWSLTVYTAAGFLPMNKDQHYSYVSEFGRTPATLKLRSTPFAGGPWISTSGARDFELFLRAYIPQDQPDNNLNHWKLPTIERGTCGADRAVKN